MTVFTKTGVAAAAVVLSAHAAMADGHAAGGTSGIYGFAFGGALFSGQLDTDGTIGGAPQSVDTDFDTGFQVGVGIGKRFEGLGTDRIGVRGEIELAYGESDADRIEFSGNAVSPEINVGGGIEATTLFANIYADFETAGTATPFVGLGLGVGHFSQDLVYGPGVRVSDSDTAFGVQLIAGSSWQVSDGVSLTADVRYRRFFDVESNRFNPAGVSTGVISGDFSDVSANVGVRFGF